MKITKKAAADVLAHERLQLIALVENLSVAELDSPSLCEGWRIRDVLAHILAYELHHTDTVKLFLKLAHIDDINNAQGRRYREASKELIIQRLRKGHRQVLRILRLIPASVFNKKFIKIKTGKISPAQIFGDLAGDRAVHYLDIAYPLRGKSQIKDIASQDLILDFMFTSMDLLNNRIAAIYHGQWLGINITGPVARQVFWQIGTSDVGDKPGKEPILSVTSTAGDFIFAITGRGALIKAQPIFAGDKELAVRLENLLSSNAFWEL